MSNKELDEKLERLKGKKDGKTEVIDEFIGNKDEVSQMAQIAEALKKQKEQEQSSLNENYVKDTIYIQQDIHAAFNALCIKQGDKKKYANEAFRDFVMKKYKQMQAE